MLLVCPGTNNGFNNINFGTKPAVAFCNCGSTFYVNIVSSHVMPEHSSNCHTVSASSVINLLR
jgi:hypothetical protein